MKHTFRLLFFTALLGLSTAARSQGNPESLYRDQPVWIGMMNDPNVNYYEALKAFDLYFQSHEMPAEPEEEMSGGSEREREERAREIRRENRKVNSEADRESLVERERMSYEVKRFRNWKREVLPFVQEDGRILSMEERMRIWEEQQKQR